MVVDPMTTGALSIEIPQRSKPLQRTLDLFARGMRRLLRWLAAGHNITEHINRELRNTPKPGTLDNFRQTPV